MLAEFWAAADVRQGDESACWLWRAVEPHEYGRFRGELAHRVAYELTRGSIPLGYFVRHRCDTPACVNPDHLLIGTARDNVHDMYRRDRARHAATPELARVLEPSRVIPLFEAPPAPRRIGRPRADAIGSCRVCGRSVRVRDGRAVPHGWYRSETLALFGARCSGSHEAPRTQRALGG